MNCSRSNRTSLHSSRKGGVCLWKDKACLWRDGSAYGGRGSVFGGRGSVFVGGLPLDKGGLPSGGRGGGGGGESACPMALWGGRPCPPVNIMTNACENITLPHTLYAAVNILTCGVPGALLPSGRGNLSRSSCITCRLVPVTGGKLGT